ncbi:MAG: DEAD/DEAH box helicase, partial [Verrucomicrobiota bacterium]
MREDWDWKEEINPSKLSEGVPLSEITGAGIYNRAIIFGCERSPYTKGLEQELGKLQTVPEDKFSNTALGAWIKRDFSAFRPPVLNNADLLEPLPLNSEQREAVENALTRPLTVITGPPGTGKSQVVSSLLINAAKRGLRVLFVSKNNKAVDVVETRVNGLGPRPVLLRLGRGEYQNNLSSYLTSLLASRATPEDSENYREAENEYGQLTARMRELQQKCQDIIALRNEVDKAEQKVEAIRTELGQEWFEHFCGLNADELLRSASGLQGSARQATREKQGFITRLFWFSVRDARMALLRNAAQTAHPVLSTVGVSIPLEPGFFDLLVVDEASQCDIASLVPLLYRAKAVAVIGDPMQLRHISAISPRRDRDLLQQHNLADTHISWAFSENSVYDLASPLADSNDIVQLRDHHRSHADIIEFSNQQFYGGNLRVATNYDRLKRLHPDGPAVRWNHVQGKVIKPGTGGALNEIEAQATVREIERMVMQQGYRGSIGVVTPFRAQANRIRDILHAHPHSHLLFAQGELLVDTVHRFQGDERDVMLFSTVVSNGIAEGALGFLRKTGYLFNVAI